VSDVGRLVTVPPLKVAGTGSGLVDVVDDLLDERGGLPGEGLAVLDGEAAASGGVQDGLGEDGVRGEVALHGFPSRCCGGPGRRGHRCAGRMPPGFRSSWARDHAEHGV
jgi:hypothetical protein